MDEAVGSVKVEDDLIGIRSQHRHAVVDEQLLDALVPGQDLVRPAEDISGLSHLVVGQFEAVEGGLPGQGASFAFFVAIQPEWILLAHTQSHDRIVPQGVVIVEILVAHRYAEDPLLE